MSRKGVDKTIHALNAPKTWHILRKKNVYVTNSKPGPHTKSESIPLNVLLRDMLNLGRTRKEIKIILNEGNLKVNGVIEKDLQRPMGLSDNLSLEKINKYYRVVLDKRGRYKVIETDKKESDIRLSKIENKTLLREGKVQLNLGDGSNVIVEKGAYKTKDTLVLKSPQNKIVKVLEHKEGNIVLITKGKHAGSLAKIEKIKDDGKLSLKEGDNLIETPEDYVLIVGEKKPEIVITYE